MFLPRFLIINCKVVLISHTVEGRRLSWHDWMNVLCVQRWAQFVREVDPDIITGYNIQNFDLSYLLTRAKHLHVDDFCYLGRVKNIQTIVRTMTLQSKQLGKRENKSINIEGRVQFDLLLVSNYGVAI